MKNKLLDHEIKALAEDKKIKKKIVIRENQITRFREDYEKNHRGLTKDSR